MYKSFECHLSYWAKKYYFAYLHTSGEQNDKRMKKLTYLRGCCLAMLVLS